MKSNKTYKAVLAALLLSTVYYLLSAVPVRAEFMSSPCYVLQMGNFNIVSGTKTSSSYSMVDTGGQTGPGVYSGASEDNRAGFANIFPTPSAPASFIPCPSPIPTPTPTPTPAPTVPPIINIIAQILAPIIATQLAQVLTQLAPAIVAALPLVVTALAVTQTLLSFLPLLFELISKLLQSIGLIPVKRPRGVVFDTKTGKGIPFATISFIRLSDNQIIDIVVSDVHGVYRSIKLPPGIYRLEAVHENYLFPSKLTPKFALNPHDFYRGESFEITSSNQEELFLIPMDPLYEETRQPASFYFQLILQILRRLVFAMFYPMVVFSVIVTIIFPTFLNLAIVALYAIMIIYRYRTTKRQPVLEGLIVDRYGKPLADVMVRCVETQTNHVGALVVTDEQGRFKVALPPLKYTLVVNKDGFVVEQPSQDYANVYITHTGSEGIVVVHMMTVKEAFPEST